MGSVSRSLEGKFFRALALAAFGIACGSRTGIFLDPVEESAPPQTYPDASQPPDARTLADAGTDGRSDTGVDAAVDAWAFAGLPPIDGTIPPDAGAVSCNPSEDGTAYLMDSHSNFYRFAPETLEFVPLGTALCDAEVLKGSAFTMAVAHDQIAYVLYPFTGNWLVRVDMSTMACERTDYAGYSGMAANIGISWARSVGGERLYALGWRVGVSSDLLLARSEVGRLPLTSAEVVVPTAYTRDTFDTQIDAFGRLWGLTNSGGLVLVDKEQAKIVAADQIPAFPQAGRGWAVLPWKQAVYVFSAPNDSSTTVLRYDYVSKTSKVLGTLPANITGSSASPCAR